MTRVILKNVKPTILLVLASATLTPQTAYKRPPEAIRKILEAPATPTASVSPSKTHMLLLSPDRYPPIAELAQPMLRLAGQRINPKNNGPRVVTSYRSAQLIDLASLKKSAVTIPAGAKLGAAQWSPDGKTVAFLAYFDDRIGVVLVDTASGRARELAGVTVNAAYGDAIDWLDDSRYLLLQLIPSGRGAAPRESIVPQGPDIQETLGKAAPAPTFQDLLKSALDEELFAYYATSQAALVDNSSGKITLLNKPGIFSALSVSPDGKYVMAQRVQRPFSWVLPASRFPVDIEIWTRDGALLKTMARQPLADRVPIEGVRTGPRDIGWAAAQPAALTWWEALDGGNPKERVPHRDRFVMSAAPFD